MRKSPLIGLAVLGSLVLPAPAVADLWTADRLSTGPTGGNAEIDARFGPTTREYKATPDGRRVVFLTSERLAADDTDNGVDAYVRSDGATTLVSVGPLGGNGGYDVYYAMISADGSTVAFSTAEGLTANDADGGVDLYKRSGDVTTLLTIGPAGEHGDCIESGWASPCRDFRGMSDDGRTVFFVTGGHLVDGDEESAQCSEVQPDKGIFDYWDCTDVYANVDGVTSLLSGPPGFAGVRDFDIPSQWISHDGDAYFEDSGAIYRWTAGTRTQVATGSIDGITDDGERLFYHRDFQIWEHSSAGDFSRTPGTSYAPLYGSSADGSHVYFTSDTALVPEDTDTALDFYEQVSGAGFQLITKGGNADSSFRFFDSTANGSKVYFRSRDPLDPADHDLAEDIYEFTSATGALKMVSTGPLDPGTSSSSWFEWVGVSNDGSRVFFETIVKLTEDDVNTADDIYERTSAGVFLVTRTPDWSEGIAQFPDGSFQSAFRQVSIDGSRVLFMTDRPLLASDTDTRFDVYAADYAGPGGGPDPGYYVHPAGATPLRVPFVPAARECVTPNSQHGGPLAFGSCSPVDGTSPFTTLGAPGGGAKSLGFVQYDVLPGAPGGIDDTDVKISFGLTNVMWRDALDDYASHELRLLSELVLTDTGARGGETVNVTLFSFDVQCSETPDPVLGASCRQTTTADAVVPGLAQEGAGAIWELGRLEVHDGGEDGFVATAPGDNLLLAVEGLFVP